MILVFLMLFFIFYGRISGNSLQLMDLGVYAEICQRVESFPFIVEERYITIVRKIDFAGMSSMIIPTY